MQREVAKLLWDAADAAGAVAEVTSGRTLPEYLDDRHLRGTVERHLEIAGEALRQALLLDEALEQRITGIRGVIGLRHRLAHAYRDTDNTVIWRIVLGDLPLLRRELEALLPPA